MIHKSKISTRMEVFSTQGMKIVVVDLLVKPQEQIN